MKGYFSRIVDFKMSGSDSGILQQVKEAVLVFVGGGCGSVLRFCLSGLMARVPMGSQASGLPWGTLTCNVLASALLGFLARTVIPGQPSSIWLLLAVGFCGGWSTFSSFSMETVGLLKAGKAFAAFGYSGLSLGLCLLAFWAAFGTANGR